MDQFPPDSHCAMRSHPEPDGAVGADAPVLPEDSDELRSELRLDLLPVERFSGAEEDEEDEELFSSWAGSGSGSRSGSGSGSGFAVGSGCALVPLATTWVTGSSVPSSETSSDSVTSPSTTVSV